MKLDHTTGHEVFNVGGLVDEAARKWGDRAVLYHYETGRTVTYSEMACMSNRVGNALCAAGVETENRVAILMDDCPEWAFILFGVFKIGAVALPMNTLLNEKDYAFFLKDSRAKVLFIGRTFLDNVQGILSTLPGLKQVIVVDGSHLPPGKDSLPGWETFIQNASGDLEIQPTFSGDVALFAYTSGSTGMPRAIMHSHANMIKCLAPSHEYFGIKEGDIQFHVPKLYFLTSVARLISAFDNGSSVVLLSGRPTPATVLEVIARYRPTFLNGTPAIFARMVDEVQGAPHLADLSSVKYIFCAGETLSPKLFQRFQETFGKSIYNCWGAQELSSAPLSWKFGETVPADKVGSVGKTPIPMAKVKICDPNGNEVPDGVAGEIMFQVESQFIGYWHEARQSSLKFFGGWYKPGDYFMRDPDGYYWYLGRMDDIVKVGGRQVLPVEVEHAVSSHPAVLEAAVIPVQNDYGLTEIQASVVLREGNRPSPELAQDIKDYVKTELAPFKRPQHVVFVSELPKTATGKIQRFRLRERALQATAGKKEER
ncbi:MAG: AMP-binding protein [Desulfobacterales bacterium]|nr:AMP-binding protein [Desulfobacterales bacterium]